RAPAEEGVADVPPAGAGEDEGGERAEHDHARDRGDRLAAASAGALGRVTGGAAVRGRYGHRSSPGSSQRRRRDPRRGHGRGQGRLAARLSSGSELPRPGSSSAARSGPAPPRTSAGGSRPRRTG